jgi:hypothetical protein
MKYIYFPDTFFGFLFTSFILNPLYCAGLLEKGCVIDNLALCTQSYYNRSNIKLICPKIEVVVSVLPNCTLTVLFQNILKISTACLNNMMYRRKKNLLLKLNKICTPPVTTIFFILLFQMLATSFGRNYLPTFETIK